jgi:hypothetical protein
VVKPEKPRDGENPEADGAQVGPFQPSRCRKGGAEPAPAEQITYVVIDLWPGDNDPDPDRPDVKR